MLDARIIDQNIGAAENLDGFGNEIAAIFGFRHICGNIDDIRTMFFGKHPGKRMVFVAVGEGVYDDVMSRGCQCMGDPEADPRI